VFRKLTLFALIVVGAFCENARATGKVDRIRCSSEWFEIESFQNGPSADKVLALCEDLRKELCRVWGGNDHNPVWESRCKIRLHPNRTSYLQKVGPNGGQTSGCSLIQMELGKVIRREIELLLNHSGELPALPHELTHVIVADKFGGREPPRWLDEGIATLSDTITKQNLHHRDCNEVVHSGRSIPIQQLVNLDSFSSPNQMPAFYGQSLLLVRMLAERNGPAKVIEFGNDMLDRGMDASLKEHYAIDNVDHLEKVFRAYVIHKSTMETQGSLVSVKYKP